MVEGLEIYFLVDLLFQILLIVIDEMTYSKSSFKKLIVYRRSRKSWLSKEIWGLRYNLFSILRWGTLIESHKSCCCFDNRCLKLFPEFVDLSLKLSKINGDVFALIIYHHIDPLFTLMAALIA